MSAENLLKKFPRNTAALENVGIELNEENVLAGVPGVERVNTENNGRFTPTSDPGLVGSFRSERSTANLLTKPPIIKPASVATVAKAPAFPKHRTPETIRRLLSRLARESGFRGETVSLNNLMAHPLYKLYNIYLQSPDTKILKRIKNTASALGYRNPIVQTLQDIVEQQVDNSKYSPDPKRNLALNSLVKVLGASTVSEGGKRRTRKTRKQRKARKTRKHRQSRKRVE